MIKCLNCKRRIKWLVGWVCPHNWFGSKWRPSDFEIIGLNNCRDYEPVNGSLYED